VDLTATTIAVSGYTILNPGAVSVWIGPLGRALVTLSVSWVIGTASLVQAIVVPTSGSTSWGVYGQNQSATATLTASSSMAQVMTAARDGLIPNAINTFLPEGLIWSGSTTTALSRGVLIIQPL